MSYLRLLQLRRAASDSGAGAQGAEGAGAGTQGAEGGKAAGAQGTESGGGGDDKSAEGSDKTFTQADIDRIVQTTIAKERARAEKSAVHILPHQSLYNFQYNDIIKFTHHNEGRRHPCTA